MAAKTPALTLGGLAGFILRYPMLVQMGTTDMNQYYDWGKRSLESSLPAYYHGIYFPLQYQIFEVCAWIVARSGLDFVLIFKLANLVFDAGSFYLLILMLKRQGSNPAYALVYWLHPWFLSIFSLGYVDPQFTFFVLLSVYLLSRETPQCFYAGVALGAAFLMKPQAQILLIAAFLYGAFRYARTRNAGALAMMVFPIVLFLAYEAYFTMTLFPADGYAAALKLPSSYLNVINVMPALTAQMPNIWYPVAYFMKEPGDHIYAISDRIHLLPYLSARFLAAATVLTLVGRYAFRVERAVEPLAGDTFTRLFGFAGVLVPFIMTSAHENHLFLGSVFLVLFIAARLPRSLKVASHVLLIVQFLNIYGLYGEHPRWIAHALRDAYNVKYLPLSYSLISIACFVVILRAIWRAKRL